MIGYSFDHEFNDTFTVRQNLRFAQNKVSQKSVYGYGMCSDPLYTKDQEALKASPCLRYPAVSMGPYTDSSVRYR